MARIDKEKLRQLAHNIMLDLSEQELEKLSNEFDVILKQMDLVQKIDTTNVHSMHFPFEITVTGLRDDEEIEQVPQAELLANAPVVEDDYIVINKVVK
ncbi:Asp-tRNA(Asn)/Glu-tRNA(Gln) amidotransferase subunit GatC [Spiroplasma eriocheiris]|uniref:Aspartyl/glutamyl-tRNA(Asn/Gln) amidotransferase subunit C n=1 Tax=Spiroplasma eriocheiris TaxID=315358 RepID=A0A0H3XNA0_9MOLU|nr:Asp-tRNA(Asn)/Glu-tRNA(Gln) amidotransferase subunit GatC [Spiroplasma eriocheiris]AHF58232.1 putative glutamyl-tRNA(gln) amidotransferase subunit C [Spiroplasma eriocheiris CCTCC M 207170]AKM54667.1 glutamyl-tRNA(Gln) amidotransferase subunit C [Spiroplasma eriocheiris]